VLAVLPLAMVAVTVTLPAAVAVSVFPLMVEPVLPALFTDHAIVLLVALSGATVPVRVRGVPAVTLVGTPEIPVTATKELSSCFVHVVPPLCLVYVPGPPPVARYLSRKSPGNEPFELKLSEAIVPSKVTPVRL